MGLKNFFAKETGNATALNQNIAESKNRHPRLPNALRMVELNTDVPSNIRAFPIHKVQDQVEVLDIVEDIKPEPNTIEETIQEENFTQDGVVSNDLTNKHTPTQEEIATRAWYIWQENGYQAGQELKNWLQAEEELSK